MKKPYIVLIIITVIIIITIITVISSRKPTSTALPAEVSTKAGPIPTKVETNPQSVTPASPAGRRNPQPKNPAAIPATYTGVSEEQNIPQAETDLATQKRDLRLKTPLTTPEFVVSFDFANDMFDVALIPPISQNKTAFEAWAAANYPLIPMDRFVIE